MNEKQNFILGRNNTFGAGWELALWHSGNRCPHGNITMAEFSARLNLKWPADAENIPKFISDVKTVLADYSAEYALWFELGYLSHCIFIESRDENLDQYQLNHSSMPEKLFEHQNKFARLIHQLDFTQEERDKLIICIQDLVNQDHQLVYPKFVAVVQNTFKRLNDVKAGLFKSE